MKIRIEYETDAEIDKLKIRHDVLHLRDEVREMLANSIWETNPNAKDKVTAYVDDEMIK